MSNDTMREALVAALKEMEHANRVMLASAGVGVCDLKTIAAAKAALGPGTYQGQWEALFWAVARELKCLPSSLASANDHVLRAAREAMAALAAPAPRTAQPPETDGVTRYDCGLVAAPAPQPAAEVKDNPDDIGTYIDALVPLPVGTKLYTVAPASQPEPVATDAMVDAYLKANDTYWREVDALPTDATKPWRQGTPREATRVSLQAALRYFSVADRKPFTPTQRRRLWDNSPEYQKAATSRAGFERIVTLVESAHGITEPEGKQP